MFIKLIRRQEEITLELFLFDLLINKFINESVKTINYNLDFTRSFFLLLPFCWFFTFFFSFLTNEFSSSVIKYIIRIAHMLRCCVYYSFLELVLEGFGNYFIQCHYPWNYFCLHLVSLSSIVGKYIVLSYLY